MSTSNYKQWITTIPENFMEFPANPSDASVSLILKNNIDDSALLYKVKTTGPKY